MAEAELYTSQEPAVDKAGRQQTTKWEPLTFSQLTIAWNCFTAVLLVKSSELALVLAHHMEVVLHIAEKRGDWVYYDVAFQGNVAKNEACWGQTHLEVFVFAMLLAHGQCTGCTPKARGQPKLYIPLGACISFHHAAYCSAGSRCIYQHCCSNANCLSNHSTSQCHKPLLKSYLVLPRLQQGQERQQSFCSSPAAYDAITPRHPPQHFGNCQQEAPHGKSHPS